jgi:hypothetical protein
MKIWYCKITGRFKGISRFDMNATKIFSEASNYLATTGILLETASAAVSTGIWRGTKLIRLI